MERIQNLMKRLGISEAEAKDLLEDDKAIDKGEKLFELTDEQKKAVKKVTRADSKPRSTPTKREKASDSVKLGLIELFTEVLKDQPMCNSVEIVNPEREFLFMWAGKKYKVTLSCPRN